MSGTAVSSTPERARAGRTAGGSAWWVPVRVWAAGLAVLAAAVAPAAAAPTPPTPATPPVAAQAGTFAYVANGLTDNVSAINTADNSVTTTFGVGEDPNGVAVSPDGSRVCVANRLSDTMSLILPSIGSVLGVDVGDNPVGVAVSADGTRCYVTNTQSNNMTVVNTAAFPLPVVATVHVGTRPQGVALAVDGTRAYIANNFDNTVAVVDTTANTLLTTIPVGQLPQGVASAPDGSRVYVTNFGDGTLSVIDTASNTVELTIPIGTDTSPADVAVSRDGTRAYTANFESGDVSVIDTAANPPSVIATVPVGEEPLGVAVTPDGTRAYATSSDDNTVSVIDTATHTVTDTITGFDIPLGVAVGTRTLGGSPTTLTLKAEGNGHGKGEPGSLSDRGPTLKVRLTGSGGPLEGKEILFSTGPNPLCIEGTDSRGRATCAVPGRRAERACYTATFPGDAAFGPASSTVCTKDTHGRPRPPAGD
ncbi:hypothetical protein [Streptomyces sp. NPDC002209]|uniref:YVTN family beta-propeller repeat protein n=1 Tax=Streptomyces sp. NPDC002209 TaxID=3364638 RepID=UPI00368CEEA8